MSYIKQLFNDIDQTDENAVIELIKYRHAYDILMDYWSDIPEEKKKEAHKRLEGLGL